MIVLVRRSYGQKSAIQMLGEPLSLALAPAGDGFCGRFHKPFPNHRKSSRFGNGFR